MNKLYVYMKIKIFFSILSWVFVSIESCSLRYYIHIYVQIFFLFYSLYSFYFLYILFYTFTYKCILVRVHTNWPWMFLPLFSLFSFKYIIYKFILLYFLKENTALSIHVSIFLFILFYSFIAMAICIDDFRSYFVLYYFFHIFLAEDILKSRNTKI